MRNFFISYNKADRTWAEWIAWELEEEGYTTILQAWDFRPSENFVIKMNQAIGESERTIAVLSPNYLNAVFTQPEWAAAFAQDPTNEKGVLLPVRVQECDLKGLYNQIIYIDFVGKNEEEAKKSLLDGIEKGRAKPLSKPSFPGPMPRSIAAQPTFPGGTPALQDRISESTVTERKEFPGAIPEDADLIGDTHEVSLFRRHRTATILLMTVVMLAAGSLIYRYLARQSKIVDIPEPRSGKSPVQRLYWDMPQDEQTRFIGEQANRISTMLGPNPTRLNEDSIAEIKLEVDRSVTRKDSLSTEAFKEGLRPVYSRASLYASFITEAFNERHVPPIIGLYIAMAETEYHPCEANQFGGEGLFGFTSKTATRYGTAANERCDPRKISRTAARYLDDLASEFGSDSASITLVILSYYIGETEVREYVHTLVNHGIRERSFWALLSHAEILDERFRLQRKKYVPRFYAVAIMGENPQAFDLQIQPLSTYNKVPE